MLKMSKYRMLVLLLIVVNKCFANVGEDNGATSLFPAPTDVHVLRQMPMKILNAQSRPAQETPGEQALIYVDFDPLAQIDQILGAPLQPPKDIKFAKKLKWMPTIENKQISGSGGDDAAIARYRTELYTIQIVRSRGLLRIFFQPRGDRRLDITPIPQCGGLPKSIVMAIEPKVLTGKRAIKVTEVPLKGGDLFHFYVVPDAGLPSLFDIQAGVSIWWTAEAFAIGMTDDVTPKGAPGPHPIFGSPGTTLPSTRETSGNSPALPQVVLTTNTQPLRLSDARAIVETIRSTLNSSHASSNQTVLSPVDIAVLFHKLQFLVQESTKSNDRVLKYACWTAAADAIEAASTPTGYVTDLAHDLVTAVKDSSRVHCATTMSNSTRSQPVILASDLELMQRVFLRKNMRRFAPEGVRYLASSLPRPSRLELALSLIAQAESLSEGSAAAMQVALDCVPDVVDRAALDEICARATDPKGNTDITAIISLCQSMQQFDDTAHIARMELLSVVNEQGSPTELKIAALRALGMLADVRLISQVQATMKVDDEASRAYATLLSDAWKWDRLCRALTSREDGKQRYAMTAFQHRTNKLSIVMREGVSTEKDCSTDAVALWLAPQFRFIKAKSAYDLQQMPSQLLPKGKDYESIVLGRIDVDAVVNSICVKRMCAIMTQSKSPEIRALCVNMLLRTCMDLAYFRQRTREPLIWALKSTDPHIRSIAAATLGYSIDVTAIEYLLPLLSDEDFEVRTTASAAICMTFGWAAPQPHEQNDRIQAWIMWTDNKAEAVRQVLNVEKSQSRE